MARTPKKPDPVAAAEISAKGAESAAKISRKGVIVAAFITAIIGALALLYVNLSKPSVPPPMSSQSVQAETVATVTQKSESNAIQVSGTVGNAEPAKQAFPYALPTRRSLSKLVHGMRSPNAEPAKRAIRYALSHGDFA